MRHWTHCITQLRLESHLVAQLAELFDLNLDHVAVLEVLGLLHPHGDTGGRSGHDDGALLKRSTLAHKGDNVFDTEEQVAGVRVLPQLSVDPRPQSQLLSGANNLDDQTH